MEDMKKNSQSLPSNYVTLRQLQERKLKEQQQKQREKEEEEERKREEQRLKEEREKQKREEEETKLQEQRLKEEQEKQNQKEEEERNLQESTKALEIKSKAFYRSNRRNGGRIFSEKYPRTRKEIHSETQKQETKAVLREEIPDQGQKLEESKKKKKKNKKKYGKNKQNPKAEETLTEDIGQLWPENGLEEKIPEALPEATVRQEGRRSTFRRRGKNSPANVGVSEQQILVNQTVEITRKIGDLTTNGDDNRVEMDGGKEENDKRSTTEMNGGRPKYRVVERFGKRYQGMSRDAGLVWVKKGEISDGAPGQAVFRRR